MTKEVEVGDIFTGKVVKTTDFGAFVELTKGTDGLLHISQSRPRASASRRSRTSSTAATRSPSRSSRSTRSAAASASSRRRCPRTSDLSRGRPAIEAYELTTLDNGLRVVSERLAGVRSVALGLWIGAGSRLETAGARRRLALHRAPDLQGHRALLGLGHRPPLRRHGRRAQRGDLQGTHGRPRPLPRRASRAGLRGARRHGRAAHLRRPRPEREVVLEEVAMYEDSPAELVHDDLAEAVFGEHPLGRPDHRQLGEPGTIDGTTVHAYHDAHYVNPAIVVAAAGHVDHERLCELAARALPARARSGGARASPKRRRRRATSPTSRRRTPSSTTSASAAWDSRRADDDRFARSVLDTILGGSSSSRLFQEVREKRGLAYSVYSYTSLFADTGLAAVYVGSRAEAVDEALGSSSRSSPARERDQRGRRRPRPQPPQGPDGALHGEPGSRMHPLGRAVLMGLPCSVARRDAREGRRRHRSRRPALRRDATGPGHAGRRSASAPTRGLPRRDPRLRLGGTISGMPAESRLCTPEEHRVMRYVPAVCRLCTPEERSVMIEVLVVGAKGKMGSLTAATVAAQDDLSLVAIVDPNVRRRRGRAGVTRRCATLSPPAPPASPSSSACRPPCSSNSRALLAAGVHTVVGATGLPTNRSTSFARSPPRPA